MAKNETPNTNVDAVLEEAQAKGLTSVPEQTTKRSDPLFLTAHSEMADLIKTTLVNDENESLTVSIVRKPGGSYEIVTSEEKPSVVEKAKGVFARNKKLVLAGLGLVATTAVLKVLASRQELEETEDESTETS